MWPGVRLATRAADWRNRIPSAIAAAYALLGPTDLDPQTWTPLVALILTACLAFVMSALSTRAAIPWLQRHGSVATGNDRTMHQGVVPKGGGLPLWPSSRWPG